MMDGGRGAGMCPEADLANSTTDDVSSGNLTSDNSRTYCSLEPGRL